MKNESEKMMQIMLEDVLEQVEAWVSEVGRLQLEKLNRKDLKIDRKSTEIDLVTEVDKLSEAILIANIKAKFPEHSILAEESGAMENDSDYRWVIDPLDGTVNFAHGFPIFGISVALQYRGDSILGLVYIPALQEMFSTIKGKGAFLNGNRLQVADTVLLNQAFLATGFPYDRATDPDNNVKYFTALITKVQGIRRTGSAAYDLCNVAAGRLDGYWEFKLNPWDVAAGTLMVTEAGGSLIYLDEPRGKGIHLIAANHQLDRVIFEQLRQVDSNQS
jgi:myo-inositol-1(or 4)-monophosphatase